MAIWEWRARALRRNSIYKYKGEGDRQVLFAIANENHLSPTLLLIFTCACVWELPLI